MLYIFSNKYLDWVLQCYCKYANIYEYSSFFVKKIHYQQFTKPQKNRFLEQKSSLNIRIMGSSIAKIKKNTFIYLKQFEILNISLYSKKFDEIIDNQKTTINRPIKKKLFMFYPIRATYLINFNYLTNNLTNKKPNDSLFVKNYEILHSINYFSKNLNQKYKCYSMAIIQRPSIKFSFENYLLYISFKFVEIKNIFIINYLFKASLKLLVTL